MIQPINKPSIHWFIEKMELSLSLGDILSVYLRQFRGIRNSFVETDVLDPVCESMKIRSL